MSLFNFHDLPLSPTMSDVVRLPGLAVANGPGALNGDPMDDDRARMFYDKFLKLHDDILAGRHPAVRTALSAPVASVPAPSYKEPELPPPQPAPPEPDAEKKDPPLVVAWREKEARAAWENARIKRQQLERELQTPNLEQIDDEPFDNLDEILARAQVMIPGSKPKNTKAPSNDSFDENSYYSSQVNSWSSDSKEKGDDAYSEAMAISSDGQASEADFEPRLEEAFEAAKDVPDETPWSNDTPPDDVMAESEGDNYSPPAVPSPEYLMTVDSDRQSPQPQAISLNHIKSPLAPQPEYISPLAVLQRQFERSNEPSRSEHERQPGGWRGKKGRQSGRGSPLPRNGKGHIHNPKKRRRQEVEEMQRKQRRARSPQSPFIKQEEVTPPPFHAQPRSRRPSGHQRTPSGKTRQVAVPPGYKLVPINDEPEYVQPAYETYQLPAAAPAPRPRPVMVDQHGNEFYAEPPPTVPLGYEMVPVQRVAPTYYERPARAATTYYEPAEYAAAGAPPLEAHYAVAPQPLMAPPQHQRAATVQSQHRYIERPATVEPPPPERAYSVRPTYVEARPEPQVVMPPLPLPLPMPLLPPPPPQFLQQLQQHHQQLQQQQRQYAPPQGPGRQDQRPQQAVARAYSVVPQARSPAEQAYRHGSAAPPQGQGMGPPRRGVQQHQPRAVSVYPARYVEREEDDHVPRGPRRGVSGRM